MRAIAAVALAVALAAVMVGCGGSSSAPASTSTPSAPSLALSTPAPTPTPSPSPTPRPTPSPPPVDIVTARRYERNGQLEEAVAAYEAIVQGAGDELLQQARLALARGYIEAGRYTDAQHQLSAYIWEGPPSPELPQAYFLLAQADAALGREVEASLALLRYIELGGAAAAYARMALADGLRVAGLPNLAIAQLQQALAEELPPPARAKATLALAQAYQEAGEDDAALNQYQLLQAEEADDATRALALWRTAAIHRRQGDLAAWREALALLVWRYPEYAVAANALAELKSAGIAVDAFAEGMVYYRQYRNAEALAAFQAYLEGQADGLQAAAAHFYVAATYERLGDYAAALDEYAMATAANPADPLADDALWWRGRLLEQLERYDEATVAYGNLRSSYPFSRWAGDALFRQGFVRYQQGDLAAAESVWATLAAMPFLPEAARAQLWLGKLAYQGGDEELAHAHWQMAASLAPTDFYGLRAEALLAGEETRASMLGASAGEGVPDAQEAESWLSERFGPEGSQTRQELFSDRRWRAGLELAVLGQREEAAWELRSLIDARSTDPWALYHLAVALSEEDLTSLSAMTASRLAAPYADAPRELLRLAYPLDYVPLVQAAARENGFPSLLLLALIRQESFFDPTAVSVAAAMGLTQVIPSTGREIAQRLGYDDFDPQVLLRPVVSIPFGAAYLGWQLELFEGNVYYALAAYSGGPGNALRWSQDGTLSDVDLFLEAIDLEETRRYVQLVLEHYATYRYLYEGTQHPTLVRRVGP
ncbi:MAG: transglycosylase SLT domain-containing protein [Dehalococcoidia bacterium]